jgi:addiction module HigA family antidote
MSGSLTIIKLQRMNTLKNPHPGDILLEDFMKPLELTAYRLAKETGMPQTRLSEIIHGRRSLTADTAVRLSAYFGNDPRFWLGLQNDFDLEEVKRKLSASSPAC